MQSYPRLAVRSKTFRPRFAAALLFGCTLLGAGFLDGRFAVHYIHEVDLGLVLLGLAAVLGCDSGYAGILPMPMLLLAGGLGVLAESNSACPAPRSIPEETSPLLAAVFAATHGRSRGGLSSASLLQINACNISQKYKLGRRLGTGIDFCADAGNDRSLRRGDRGNQSVHVPSRSREAGPQAGPYR